MSSGIRQISESSDDGGQPFPAPVDDMFDMLGDSESLAILQATSDSAQTASELEDQLEISCSTLYRKLNCLADMSLLEVRYRPKRNGHHSKEYKTSFEEIFIRLPDGEEATLFQGN
ncbi:helix-turn-helix domain-containing protein [Halorubrum sp. CBA1125]|uniref:ArsR/SmtB family transcription factor n=1 Tax=Halorubrum sp. CBA1125 TaxID=2668072 RepID=UPI0012E76430|nr:winged helix-turn-helix domain-containing protein [Halorubrum sp. CBA1125]MUW13551.1 helix-turn-helix domain-containing protein [Halorubrum sp. CBA1125]